jgi:hypothetical protein
MAWPNFDASHRSAGRQSGGSTGCNENAQLAPSEKDRSLKSADGRMAAVATRRRRKTLSNEKKKEST